jgi:hypothetical protein
MLVGIDTTNETSFGEKTVSEDALKLISFKNQLPCVCLKYSEAVGSEFGNEN